MAQAIDLVYPPEQVDQKIDTVHAGRGHCPGRRFHRVGAPVVGAHREAGGCRLLALAMAQDAEPPVGDAPLQFRDRRMEAPWIGDGEHDPRPRRGVQRALGAGNIERERLLHEDGLARRGGALHLRPVLAVRRCKDDGINRRVGEERIKIICQRNPVLSAEALGGGACAGIAGSEADRGALALHSIHQHPSPPPDADDRGTDHFDFLLPR